MVKIGAVLQLGLVAIGLFARIVLVVIAASAITHGSVFALAGQSGSVKLVHTAYVNLLEISTEAAGGCRVALQIRLTAMNPLTCSMLAPLPWAMFEPQPSSISKQQVLDALSDMRGEMQTGAIALAAPRNALPLVEQEQQSLRSRVRSSMPLAMDPATKYCNDVHEELLKPSHAQMAHALGAVAQTAKVPGHYKDLLRAEAAKQFRRRPQARCDVGGFVEQIFGMRCC